ncbi:MAG: hypothetical protein ACT4N4_08910, partial [Rhodospirillales bacterium]
AESEQAVQQATNNLQAIRTAYAQAQQAGQGAPAAPGGADLSAQLLALQGRFNALNAATGRLRSAAREMEALAGQLNTAYLAASKIRSEMDKVADEIDNADPHLLVRNALEPSRSRVRGIESRLQVANRVTSCAAEFDAAAAALEQKLALVSTKLATAGNAVNAASAVPPPSVQVSDIEAIFNTARPLADAAANAATNAVRCHAAADATFRQAAAPPPPPVVTPPRPPVAPPPTPPRPPVVGGGTPPPTGGPGLTCHYMDRNPQRYSVTVYDRKDCPVLPTGERPVATAPSGPPPQMRQEPGNFAGRWISHDNKRGLQLSQSSGGTSLSGTARLYEAVRGDNSNRRTGQSTLSCQVNGNQAVCKESGNYIDRDKDIAFTSEITMSLSGNNALSTRTRILTATPRWKISQHYQLDLQAGTVFSTPYTR